MQELWSKNRYINLSVNILIFLVAINFMHIGQLFLPIICLILFIDNKFKFKVKDLFSFIVLCLFAITFAIFAPQLGMYRFVGFFLPMANYIGSNVFKSNKEKNKRIIYLIIFGMVAHLMLNFISDYQYFGIELMTHKSHFDFWTKDLIATTSTAGNSVLIISIAFFIIKIEKNKIRTVLILLLLFSIFYDVGLGRRTPFLILIIVNIITMLFYYLKIYNSYDKKVNINKIFLSIIIMIVLITLCYLNVFGIKDLLSELTIVKKIKGSGLNSGRISLTISCLKLMPHYLFGGGKISEILSFQVHNLWMDVYDCAGIFPFIFIVIYTLLVIKKIIKIIKSKNSDIEQILLLMSIELGTLLYYCVEPIISGATIYLICLIIIESTYDKYEEE